MPIKYLKKIKNIISILIFINFFVFFLLFPLITPAQATPNASMPTIKNPFDSLQIKIPGMKKFTEAVTCPDDPTKTCIPWIGEYIAGIYRYAIGIIGILAAVVLMIGGVMWVVAGGSSTIIGEAKSWIGASLTGLIIALCSYLILNQINPALTVFGPLGITQVEKVAEMTTTTNCFWEEPLQIPASGLIPAITSNTCTSGTKSDNTKCPARPTNMFTASSQANSFCCCTVTAGGGWGFDPGIEAQRGDASPELTKLLNCMREYLPVGYGHISSISDSNCVGNLMACRNMPEQCTAGSTRTDCRWHGQWSCHYGQVVGPLYGKKSYAVDLSDKNPLAVSSIERAARDCGAKFIGREGTHLHISAKPCSSN